MRTALTYASLVHDHDAVGMLDSGQTVRNHDCCSAIHELFKRLLYENFCLCIYVGVASSMTSMLGLWASVLAKDNS